MVARRVASPARYFHLHLADFGEGLSQRRCPFVVAVSHYPGIVFVLRGGLLSCGAARGGRTQLARQFGTGLLLILHVGLWPGFVADFFPSGFEWRRWMIGLSPAVTLLGSGQIKEARRFLLICGLRRGPVIARRRGVFASGGSVGKLFSAHVVCCRAEFGE